MISEKKLKEIANYYVKHGKEKTIEAFDLKEETYNRHMRSIKKHGLLDFDRDRILKMIKDNYTDKELQAIANGGRILAGVEKVPIISFEGQRVRIGAITDTHIGHVKFDEKRLFQGQTRSR